MVFMSPETSATWVRQTTTRANSRVSLVLTTTVRVSPNLRRFMKTKLILNLPEKGEYIDTGQHRPGHDLTNTLLTGGGRGFGPVLRATG